jgi:hypothetical protein
MGEIGVVEGVGLNNPNLATLPPEAGKAVEGADDDGDEEGDEEDKEPDRAEHLEQLEALQEIDDAPAQHGVVLGVELVHLAGVVGGRAEGKPRELAEGEPDAGQDGQEKDLEDGKVDGGEEAPELPAEPSQGMGRSPAPDEGPPEDEGGDG